MVLGQATRGSGEAKNKALGTAESDGGGVDLMN